MLTSLLKPSSCRAALCSVPRRRVAAGGARRLLPENVLKPPGSSSQRLSSSSHPCKSKMSEKIYQGEKQHVEKTQEYPGHHHSMDPFPLVTELPEGQYQPANKLKGKKAIITGGDSGIGKAVAALYAMEGASTVITYMKGSDDEKHDAEETQKLVESLKGKTHTFALDAASADSCRELVDFAVKQLGGLDILVNNAGFQSVVENFAELTDEQWDHTFKVNIYSQFWITKAALPHLHKGSSVINCSSVNAFKGNPKLVDYTSTKGAILGFTRSLALQWASKGIRVNAVAPGPIATPLVSSTFPKEHIDKQSSVPLGRGGQPVECATCFVFLASQDSSYMTGQTLHPNGGTVLNC